MSVPTDTLPVVVHVIHTGTAIGSPDNPTDASINAMITSINNSFQKNGPLYGGADMQLAFRLATKNPQCGSTTGIIRINGSSVPHYVSGGITTDTMFYPNSAHELYVKALSRWPNTDYINIWIVNVIDGDPFGSAGYAYFPEYNGALTDGIVLRADAVNSTNKTIVHEFGHFFSLFHSFGDNWVTCAAESNCATQGDWICDTERCLFTFDCSLANNPCTGMPWQIADVPHGYTVLNNYMGYADCAWMYTEGQKTRMLNALNMFRPGLLNSSALNGSSGNIPVLGCVPTAVNGLSPYYGIQRVIIGSLNVYSNSSLADAQFYVDRTCNQQITVTAGQSVTVDITASYFNYSQIRVYLDFDNDGVFEPPGELILSGDGGSISGNVVMSFPQMKLCTLLRLRVVADHPAAPMPTPCLLTGTPADGVGQIEDYTVIIKPRPVESVATGNWNTPAVWSCNCIPSANDAILIKSGHIITVPLALGTVNCAAVRLQPTGQLRAFANVHVAGGCL